MKLNHLSEEELLNIKLKARDVRRKYNELLLSTDVFDILNYETILIRKPYEGPGKFSGFTTYFNNRIIVYLNTAFTLGHERFTAAHELYHVLFNRDYLEKNKLIYEESEKLEAKANYFAVEYLMPEELVKKQYFEIVGHDQLEVKHIIRLIYFFRVSYRAMLRRLQELGLCTWEEFEQFKKMGAKENSELLQKLVKKGGYSIDLITPSKVTSIPQKYLNIIIDNYELGKISFGKFKSLLEFIGKTPEDFGYEVPKEEEFL